MVLQQTQAKTSFKKIFWWTDMLFSHISDTHLGLQQYGLEEREQDIYDSFNQAINISINDHVDFVIFAGDIFHTPNPSGTAILQMANALKRLTENSID